MTCRERLERYFRENGVKYQVHSHPEVYTAQEVAAVAHVPGRVMATVVMALIDGTLTAWVRRAAHAAGSAPARVCGPGAPHPVGAETCPGLRADAAPDGGGYCRDPSDRPRRADPAR